MKRVSKKDQTRLVAELELLLAEDIASEVVGHWVMINERLLLALMRQGLPAAAIDQKLSEGVTSRQHSSKTGSNAL